MSPQRDNYFSLMIQNQNHRYRYNLLLISNTHIDETQFCFHRPLHELFAPFFRAGLVMDALEEVDFDRSFRDPVREYAARNYTQFPKILAFRMRPAPLNG